MDPFQSAQMLELRAELRTVARDLLGKAGPAAGIDWRLIAECGWSGLEVPDSLDGAGVTFGEVAVVLEELGRVAARSSYLGAVVLAAGTLSRLAPGPARDELLRATAEGTTVTAAALVDGADDGLGAGVPFRIEATADGRLLHGRAQFVPDAVGAGRVLLLALDAGGEPVVVVLAPDAAGLAITPQPVLDETRGHAVVEADGVAVGEEAVLRFAGDPGAEVSRLLDRAALALACDSLGLAEAMLDATVAHAKAREQFGRPIGSFQAVQHACANMLVQVALSRQLVADAVAAVAQDLPEAGVAVSMAKSYTCSAAVDVAGKAMQLHGGMGYTWESGVHVYLKRAALNRSLFGSTAAHRRRLARRYLPPSTPS
jgi:alkylation response protein AidB-like acyl-CoA dehydrogenase